MASILPPARNNFFLEQLDFKSGLSEALFFRLGQQNNFNNQRFYVRASFRLNEIITGLDGEVNLDGLEFTPFNAEVFEVFVYQGTAGSGVTEFDIEESTDNGATWTSIFSTRPKIESTASDNLFFKIGDTDPSFTAPVLSGTTTSPIDSKTVKELDAGTALRLNVITSQDNAANAGIVIYMRPR